MNNYLWKGDMFVNFKSNEKNWIALSWKILNIFLFGSAYELDNFFPPFNVYILHGCCLVWLLTRKNGEMLGVSNRKRCLF